MLTADKINLAIAIISGVSTLASLAVVIVTVRILRATRDTVAVMREQVEATTRPYVLVSPWVRHGGMLMLTIGNSGASTARNLRLSLDQAFYMNGDESESMNLATYSAFTKPIQSLPPKAEFEFHLGVGFTVMAKPDRCPRCFTVRAQYEFEGGEVDESTTVDLQPFDKTAVPVDPVVDQLSKLNDHIKAMRETFRQRTQERSFD